MSVDDRGPDPEWLDALAGAWQRLPPPSPDRPLAEQDPATRRAVEWMRSAWLALPVPAALPPRVVRRPFARGRWLRVAAAAALLFALGAPVLVVAWRARRGEPPALAPDATVIAVDAHKLELRSGPVRLYLFTDPITPLDEVPR
jgi:hypothetical protein